MIVGSLRELYTNFKWRERKVSYGKDNADRTFYVIRRANCKSGLFSYVMTNLGRMKYAIDHGFIPVVDMQNEKNTYLRQDQVGKENAWEFYFEQPCGYSLDDIKNSKNIILGQGEITKELVFPGDRTLFDPSDHDMWYNFCRSYLKIKKDVLDSFEQQRVKMWGDAKVLGVLSRGTDYFVNHPKGHTIQPTFEQLRPKVDEVFHKFGCERIFLATEDSGIYKRFEQEYGDRLIVPDVKRYDISRDQNINDVIIDSQDDMRRSGEEYLRSIWMLSKCDCLVAGNVSGSLGAMMLTEGYEYSYIFDLGLYP